MSELVQPFKMQESHSTETAEFQSVLMPFLKAPIIYALGRLFFCLVFFRKLLFLVMNYFPVSHIWWFLHLFWHICSQDLREQDATEDLWEIMTPHAEGHDSICLCQSDILLASSSLRLSHHWASGQETGAHPQLSSRSLEKRCSRRQNYHILWGDCRHQRCC